MNKIVRWIGCPFCKKQVRLNDCTEASFINCDNDNEEFILSCPDCTKEMKHNGEEMSKKYGKLKKGKENNENA